MKWLEAKIHGENFRWHCTNADCGVYHQSVLLKSETSKDPHRCHVCESLVELVDTSTLVQTEGLGKAALRRLVELGEIAQRALSRIYYAETKVVEQRLGNDNFEDHELVYAAWQRCSKCHAGFAHPKNIGGHGAWYCSTMLKDKTAKQADHDQGYGFTTFSIKSEGQPSANGATTRPKPS